MLRTISLLVIATVAQGCSSPKLDRSPPKQRQDHPTSPGVDSGVHGPRPKGLWPGRFPFKVLYIVRHSSTVFNRYSQIGGQIQYDPLDSLGFKERVGIFLLLRNEPIRAIFTSMQRRSQMTAAPLAAHLRLKIQKTPALNEFAGGVSEGICYSLMGKKPRTQEAVACDQPSDDPLVARAEAFLRSENRRRFKVGIAYRWPGGGESIQDVDRRLDRWLRTLPTSLASSTVALFGHSGTNRFLLAKLMGWKLLDALRVRQGHTQVWRIERKASGHLELKMFLDGAWRLCREPPTMSGSLPCLSRFGRRRSVSSPPRTEVHELSKGSSPARPGTTRAPGASPKPPGKR